MEGVGGRTGRGALPGGPTDLAGTSRPLGDGPIVTSGPPNAPRSLVQKRLTLSLLKKTKLYGPSGMPGATCDILAAPGTAWEARDAPTTSALMWRIKNALDFSKPPTSCKRVKKEAKMTHFQDE